ncbi:MAG TPA: hypothetical protein DHV28_17555 [Ignavibacteriales bacterium]|nr:hypothetical protein [Ignavibacteriales bacterium]
MNNQFDKELIIDVIEAIETLCIDGFHWGKKDKEFSKSQEELKKSIDKIIICLEWIDREYTLEAYMKASGLRAGELKRGIEASEETEMPLGCVITAIAFNYHRFRYIKTMGWEDIIFYAPADIVRELKSRMKRHEEKISPERLQQILEE